MKSVLISIQPRWCELIASGKKTVEVRKTRPKIDTPFKCYIYCTEGDALAYPCLNNPHFAIHKMITSHSLYGRRLTKKEREESDYTFANGKVIGEFLCDHIMRHCEMANADIAEQQSKVKREKILEYANGNEVYGWHISDLVIYEKPRELGEFRKYIGIFDGATEKELEELGILDARIKRPPQSWCYVETTEKGGAE